MTQLIDFDKNTFETPPEIFEPLMQEFNFTMDVCATPETAKCPVFFTPEIDGLNQSWLGHRCWMNPPYNDIPRWLEKARMEMLHGGVLTVALLPAKTDTRWWHEYIQDKFTVEVRFLKGRVAFLDPRTHEPIRNAKGQIIRAMFPSAVVIFGPQRLGGYERNTSFPSAA